MTSCESEGRTLASFRARRLDRMNHHMERIEWETQVSVEALAIFVRAWLTSTPRLSAEDRAAAQAVGLERYGSFLDTLTRRLSNGQSLMDRLFDAPDRHERDVGQIVLRQPT